MKIVKKFIIEEPDGTWDPHREGPLSKIPIDKFSRVSLAGGSYFIKDIRRTRPYRPSPLSLRKNVDEIYLFSQGVPTTVPLFRDFKEMKKIEESCQFTSQQMELLAREKETSLYLHQTRDVLLMLMCVMAGFGLGTIVMYALQKWKG